MTLITEATCTTEEAAAELSMHASGIRQLIKGGALRASRPDGHTWRVNVEDVVRVRKAIYPHL